MLLTSCFLFYRFGSVLCAALEEVLFSSNRPVPGGSSRPNTRSQLPSTRQKQRLATVERLDDISLYEEAAVAVDEGLLREARRFNEQAWEGVSQRLRSDPSPHVALVDLSQLAVTHLRLPVNVDNMDIEIDDVGDNEVRPKSVDLDRDLYGQFLSLPSAQLLRSPADLASLYVATSSRALRQPPSREASGSFPTRPAPRTPLTAPEFPSQVTETALNIAPASDRAWAPAGFLPEDPWTIPMDDLTHQTDVLEPSNENNNDNSKRNYDKIGRAHV